MALAISFPARLSSAPAAEVHSLAERIEARDGEPPLSDQALITLSASTVRHVLAHDGTDIAGYAQLDGTSLEVAARDISVADALVTAVEELAVADMRVWSHGRRSPVAAVLAARGYRQARVLRQLRMRMAEPVVLAPLDAGITVRPFVAGQDEQAWLEVNAAAFAGHAEQGRWGIDDLLAREREPWFDAAGFLLAVRGDTLLGFHWTKVHADGTGEVYVLGVDPAAQGLGLGPALLTRGLAHLAGRGVPEVLLYVDGDNEAAARLYERTGFREFDVDAQWMR